MPEFLSFFLPNSLIPLGIIVFFCAVEYLFLKFLTRLFPIPRQASGKVDLFLKKLFSHSSTLKQIKNFDTQVLAFSGYLFLYLAMEILVFFDGLHLGSLIFFSPWPIAYFKGVAYSSFLLLPHGILESLGRFFLYAVPMSAFIGIAKPSVDMKDLKQLNIFHKVLMNRNARNLISIGLLLLLIASIIEVYVTGKYYPYIEKILSK